MTQPDKTPGETHGLRLWPKKKPVEPALPPQSPGMLNYMKALAIFRQIPIEKLGPVVALVPLIVFFAISGFIAWAAVLLGLFLRLVWSIFRGFRRGSK
jgi:hypothetical protein